MKDYDKKGIAAVIALQALVGIKETKAKATRGWLAMDPHEREQTMLAHEALCGEKKAARRG